METAESGSRDNRKVTREKHDSFPAEKITSKIIVFVSYVRHGIKGFVVSRDLQNREYYRV